MKLSHVHENGKLSTYLAGEAHRAKSKITKSSRAVSAAGPDNTRQSFCTLLIRATDGTLGVCPHFTAVRAEMERSDRTSAEPRKLCHSSAKMPTFRVRTALHSHGPMVYELADKTALKKKRAAIGAPDNKSPIEWEGDCLLSLESQRRGPQLQQTRLHCSKATHVHHRI